MKPRFIKLFLALFLPFASFLLLAHFLFYYNNKYENNPVYPMGGVMFCSDADLSGDSVIFLAHQWNFFPGKQYPPSDFNEKKVTGGTFLTLGSFGNFSLGNTSEASNGTATYRLTLSLPDTARTYSLYLPAIFSALIGNKEISFTASGTVHITIIVTNYSHIYSGITYPPVFGTVTAIQKYLSTRLFISGITLAAIFLFAACSLFFFCRLKHKNALIFTILCSLFFVVSLYPVLFSYGSYSVFPWYPLEIACLTAMYPCMVLLQGTILNLPKKLIRRETLIFGSCVVFSLVFTLFLHGSTHFAKIFIFIQSRLRPFAFISGILFVSERIAHVTNSLNWYGFVCRFSDRRPHVSGLRADLRRLVSGNRHFFAGRFHWLRIVAGFFKNLPRQNFF